MSLWDLNPLVLTCQVNSFTIVELQLRVFQMVGNTGFEPVLFLILAILSRFELESPQ